MKVPKVYGATRRILVMEFVEGGKVDDLKYLKRHKISPGSVSTVLSGVYNKMIFEDG